MTTQIIFNIDSKLKQQAMKKAQAAGLPFAAVLKLATRAFVDGHLDIGLVGTERFNPTTAREVRSALRDIKQNKNLSPRLNSAKEVSAFLRS